MRGKRTHTGAATWGFAEATLFFIVPDVFLSWVALKHPRKAFIACFWTLAGALVGGALIFYLGRTNPQPVGDLFISIPAISGDMLQDVKMQLQNDGLTALFIGPLIGTPYKIYALQAAQLGLAFIPFLLVSIPARLVRFVLVTALAALVSRMLKNVVSLRALRAAHIVLWIGFYTFYFSVMP